MKLFRKPHSFISEIVSAFLFAIRTKIIRRFFAKMFCFFRRDFRVDRVLIALISDLEALTLRYEEKLNEGFLTGKKPKMPGKKIEIFNDILVLNDSNIWKKRFGDREQLFYLHRFSWAYYEIDTKRISICEFADIAQHWIVFNRKKDKKNGWDSYSISERVSNWCILLNPLKTNLKLSSDINGSICEQLDHLLENLEFRGTSTNNHILNNARALYIGGCITNEDKYSESGRLIIKNVHKMLFSKNGMSREGSSHYQVIFTKWLLEILWFAYIFKDKQFINQIKGPIYRNLQASIFFLDFKDFPFIGDISPDFDVSFFIDMPKIGNQIINGNVQMYSGPNLRGWAAFFGASDYEHEHSQKPSADHFQDDGYYLVENKAIKILAYVNPKSHTPPGSHGHSDVGSFILWYKDKIIFDDNGRAKYDDSELSYYGRSIVSHNGIMIDKKEPLIIHGLNGYPELHTPEFLGRSPEVNVRNNNGKSSLNLTYYGYGRIGEKIVISRNFVLKDNSLEIIDDISGKNRHEIDTYFHITSECDIELADYCITLKDQDSRITLSAKNSNQSITPLFDAKYTNITDMCAVSKKYGEVSKINSIVYRQTAVLPKRNKYRLHFS